MMRMGGRQTRWSLCQFLLYVLMVWCTSRHTIGTVDAAYSIVLSGLSGHEECMVVHAPVNVPSTIHGNFDCLDDDLEPDPVSVWLVEYQTTITDANDKKKKKKKIKQRTVWKSTKGDSEDVFEYHTKTGGRYALCLSNTRGEEDRHVGFALRVTSFSSQQERSLPEEEAGPDKERALQLVDWSIDLLDSWDDLSDHYDYLRDREVAHRDVTEQTFSRIVAWTLVEAVVLVMIASGQVMYLRKFFEKRHYL